MFYMTVCALSFYRNCSYKPHFLWIGFLLKYNVELQTWTTSKFSHFYYFSVKSYFILIDLSLKAHSKVWDNFWQLKPLQKWWKCFHFTLKALFVLKIFKFFSWRFSSCIKMAWLRKIMLILKIMTSQPG